MSASTHARYPIPAGIHRAELIIERSRFIATLGPAGSADEAAAFMETIAAEFPDATHNCWAFVAGPPGSTGHVGMSDAGEPHGTAGRPMLTTLLHSGIGDVAAVVTRYYGGTKLGTGGLARAYAGAVNHALATLPRAERVAWAHLEVRLDYAIVGAVQLLLPALEAEIVEQSYADAVTYRLRAPEPRLAELRAALLEVSSGRAVFAGDPP